MSATINIVETTTELGVEVVEVTVTDASAPGPAGPGVPTGGTAGQVLTKDSGTDYDTSWQDSAGGAVDAEDVDFTPAGNLAATDVQAALEELDSEKAATSHAHAGEDITSGTVADARIASTIARDSEVTAAVSASEAGQVRDGDAAGGVLGGTYPNPSFAADMATQAELDAHVNDTTAAHAASAISVDSTDLDGTGTDLQTVLEELEDQIDAGGGGGAPTDVDYLVGTASGGLSAEIVVGTSPGGELGGTWASPTVDATHSGSSHASVQAAAEATAAAALSAHVTDTSDAHDASAISVLDTAGDYTATDVEGVLAEIAPQLGGGVDPYLLFPGDKPPASPNAMDDEFDDSSFNTTLWADRNSGPSKDESTYPGVCLLTASADSGTNVRGIEQAISGSFDIRAKLTAMAFYPASTSDTPYWGIYAANNSSGKLVTCGIEVTSFSSIGYYPRAVRWNSATSGPTAGITTGGSPTNLRAWPIYFRLVSDGTNLLPYISLDGIAWVKVTGDATETIATHLSSIDRVGIFVQSKNGNSQPLSVVAHWFRRVS
jgi:hypothetical protein